MKDLAEHYGVDPNWYQNCAVSADALCKSIQSPDVRDAWNWKSDGQGCQIGAWIGKYFDGAKLTPNVEGCKEKVMGIVDGFSKPENRANNRGKLNVNEPPADTRAGRTTGTQPNPNLPGFIVQG